MLFSLLLSCLAFGQDIDFDLEGIEDADEAAEALIPPVPFLEHPDVWEEDDFQGPLLGDTEDTYSEEDYDPLLEEALDVMIEGTCPHTHETGKVQIEQRITHVEAQAVETLGLLRALKTQAEAEMAEAEVAEEAAEEAAAEEAAVEAAAPADNGAI